jgi:hypothetical protein
LAETGETFSEVQAKRSNEGDAESAGSQSSGRDGEASSEERDDDRS